MKISYIADTCAYGGTETAIKNRMDYLKNMGVESQFIFLSKGFEEEIFSEYTHFIIKSREQLVDITKDSDVVIALSPYINDTLQILDKNIVVESHYGLFEYIKRQLYSKGIKAVIFPTKRRLNEARPYIPQGLPAFVIPNCLGKSFIEGTISPHYPSKENIKEILWVGRIDNDKNWMILPNLAERLPDNYKIKLIAGVSGEHQKKDYKALLQNIQGKPYSNKIETIINCPYSKIAEYYLEAAASGCYLSTSYCESFGMTVLEAMASMCPMVLSNLMAFKEVAGDSALYFNLDDINACLNYIVTICNDSSLRTSMISKMSNIYKLNFNPIKICSDYLNVLHSVID